MCDALEQEMQEVAMMCNDILKWKPDIVITEKGVSDLAQHFLLKGNVSAIRRIRKTDNVRIARVSGANIVNRPEELQESDVGTECGLFDIRKIGDDYFSFFVECKAPTACSIISAYGFVRRRSTSMPFACTVSSNASNAALLASSRLAQPSD